MTRRQKIALGVAFNLALTTIGFCIGYTDSHPHPVIGMMVALSIGVIITCLVYVMVEVEG